MVRFMRRPEYFDAIQFTGDNVGEVLSFIVGRELAPFEIPEGCSINGPVKNPECGVRIFFEGGTKAVIPGLWLLRAHDGRLHTASDDAICAEYAVEKKVVAPVTPTKNQIAHMVDRFLRWRLPDNFMPDCGISFEPVAGKDTGHEFLREPQGTNLLNASQARAMILHLFEGLPEE